MLAIEETAGARWSATALDELARLAATRGLTVARDEPLARYTSMGVGGPCPLMLWPRRSADVVAIAEWVATRGLGWRTLGGGSNLLVGADGVDEPVVQTARMTEGSRLLEGSFRAPAGMPTARALRTTVAAGADGLVWSAGLPGSIGGAAAGNAGCWGGDMATSTTALEIVDGRGREHVLPASDLAWSYRRLELPERVAAPWIIVAVTVGVTPGDPAALEARYLELQEKKRERQPVGARNSGCVFRNPDGARAGELLDRAGCKGMRVGAAEVSRRHANFIVNRGGATAADIIRLVDRLVERVRDRAGIDLQQEIRRW